MDLLLHHTLGKNLLDTDEWNIRASVAAHPKWCGTSHSGLQYDIEHNLMILRFFVGKHFTAIW